jgi:hypothetical protein
MFTRCCSFKPHGVTSQKTPFFIDTTVKTSKLTKETLVRKFRNSANISHVIFLLLLMKEVSDPLYWLRDTYSSYEPQFDQETRRISPPRQDTCTVVSQFFLRRAFLSLSALMLLCLYWHGRGENTAGINLVIQALLLAFWRQVIIFLLITPGGLQAWTIEELWDGRWCEFAGLEMKPVDG